MNDIITSDWMLGKMLNYAYFLSTANIIIIYVFTACTKNINLFSNNKNR